MRVVCSLVPLGWPLRGLASDTLWVVGAYVGDKLPGRTFVPHFAAWNLDTRHH